MSREVPEPDRHSVPAPREDDMSQGARRQQVPLDAPDVVLRGQRLLAYGDRLRREEVETGNPGAGRACHPARPRRPPARQEWLEKREVRMPALLSTGGRDDVRMRGQARLLRNEERIYVEPPGAPEIGRRPRDLNVGQGNVAQNERIMMQPVHLRREAPIYDEHTGLQLRPEYHTGWECKCNLVWPS